ncbi:MAG TPA: RtcB family protein [Actinomycetota bacterium]|nr:RtcB family protein [Actinomycetota bacterium]
MPVRLSGKLVSWASILDPQTEAQARATAELPVVEGHVALMPDAHLGKGATIGSVIPTRSAVIPSAVGVDIGCGMAARRLDLAVDEVEPEDLAAWVRAMWRAVPAGLGRWHGKPTVEAARWMERHPAPPTLENRRRALEQLGTLGSGNHFVELAADDDGLVWILLHSGSRGPGNKLATLHTRIARTVCSYPLEDPELAWFEQGTPEFDAYLRDLRWSQRYAARNRELMLAATHRAFEEVLGRDLEATFEVNCHHNYTELETHAGRRLWVTRKGAIRAGVDDWGLVPGAMGQRSFVVKGLGNPESYESSAHGAGRALSRSQARRTLSVDAFAPAMGDAAWQHEFAEQLLDEHPSAYKPIDVVMKDQADLVEVVHELRAIANYKGTT